MLKKILLFGVFVTLLSIVLLAGTQITTSEEPANETELQQEIGGPETKALSGNMYAYLFKVLTVVACAGIALFFLIRIKKGSSVGGYPGSSAAPISVRAVKALGPRKSLYFVEALGHVLLLGVTDS